MVVRLNQHLTKNRLHEVLQNAYKQNHSIETALLKVRNDLMAIDTYGRAVLILLDLSAAFDTIDHIYCCNDCMSWERDAALDWFKSYLSQRRQSVVINGIQSSHRNQSFSASGISTWPNTIHPVHNIAGSNSMKKSAKFPSLCWWHTAVHGIQAKQCGIITPRHQ